MDILNRTVMNEGDNNKKTHNTSPNSIESYKEINGSGTKVRQLDTFRELVGIYQPVIAQDLERISGLRTSSVTARLKELVLLGTIKRPKSVKSRYSGKTVYCYTLPDWVE